TERGYSSGLRGRSQAALPDDGRAEDGPGLPSGWSIREKGADVRETSEGGSLRSAGLAATGRRDSLHGSLEIGNGRRATGLPEGRGEGRRSQCAGTPASADSTESVPPPQSPCRGLA